MGATGIRRFTDVMLPLARPSIVGAATLVFLFTFTSFGVALLLAGPARATIEVEIFRQTSQLLNLPVAAALTLVQLAIVSALLVAHVAVSNAGPVCVSAWSSSADAARAPRTTGERRLRRRRRAAARDRRARAAAATRVAIGSNPDRVDPGALPRPRQRPPGERVADLAARRRGDVAAGRRGRRRDRDRRRRDRCVGRSRARRRGSWLRGLSAVPLGVSAVTVGFGYVVAFDSGALDLRGSIWLLVAAQAVVALPFVVRLVEPVLTTTRHDLTEQAAALGASPWQTARDVLVAGCLAGDRSARPRSPSPCPWVSSARARSWRAWTRRRCRSRSCACSRSRGRLGRSGHGDERGADGGDRRRHRGDRPLPGRHASAGSDRAALGACHGVRSRARAVGAVVTCTTAGSSEAFRIVSSVPAGTSTACHWLIRVRPLPTWTAISPASTDTMASEPLSAIGADVLRAVQADELAPDALGLEQHLGVRGFVVEPHEVSACRGASSPAQPIGRRTSRRGRNLPRPRDYTSRHRDAATR